MKPYIQLVLLFLLVLVFQGAQAARSVKHGQRSEQG
jgi:hypothetical protein